MKTITRIFATLCVLGAAAACQQYEIDTQMTPEKELRISGWSVTR